MNIKANPIDFSNYKIAPIDLPEDQARKVAIKEINHTLSHLGHKIEDYQPKEMEGWINKRTKEVMNRYRAAIEMLDM